LVCIYTVKIVLHLRGETAGTIEREVNLNGMSLAHTLHRHGCWLVIRHWYTLQWFV